MMDLTFEQIRELSAVATILIVVLVAVWRGIPALIAYLERKDIAHREDIMTLVNTAREERDAFYKNLGIKLDRIHDRLDTIETTITKKAL
jgi:hypothetical protein